ncbi:immunity 49 family protein [Streptomyces sp. 2314.4]|uniref:immunity 49 family protein n=1 Tax=Streptomyces sp. 2314.4 TaxID=1881025 RepID=UPI0008995AFA|nr:immunity 49 family protein [Streptomyces sp. 2314.4]SEC11374.1 Immunity protein 49 [Streptomyces sp. 2314.4]
MVTSVPRHDFPADATQEDMAALMESTSRVIGRLEQSEMARSRALNSTLTVAMSCCAADPQATKLETWEAWVTAMQVGSALFDSAVAAEGPVPCRIGIAGEVKHLPATGPTPYTHAGAWLTAVYLATICRENERLDRLMQVPVSFLRESGAVFDEYVYSWVEALQGYWFRRADGMWNKLVEAVDGASPQVARIADEETLLKILYPPLELFQLYNRGETEKFNASLAEFLTWHKQYWTGDEARSLDSDGLVALAPLAIACMAYDNGFPIEVDSEYLPKELLQFGWVGEVDA